MQDIVQQMIEHAAEKPGEEVCGLVVSNKVKSAVLRGTNVARNRLAHFDLDPEVFLRVPDGWEVVASYHSHPNGIVTPSPADLAACEASNMPMHIVCAGNQAHHEFSPSGYRAPYLKRPYVFGVHDCWSLVRDWYDGEFGIKLPQFDYEQQAYHAKEDVFVRNIEKAGFVNVRGMPVQHGDVMLIQVGNSYPNHAAIWLDSARILHHVTGRVSKEDHWCGYWAQHMSHHVRHQQRL